LQVDRALSEDEGHFIAGFMEGEAHFGLVEQNGGQSFTCFVNLRLRDDDADLVHWLARRTGTGTLRAVPAQATARPQVEWRVYSQADCQAIADLLTRFQIRGRKRREFDVWKAAVELWRSGLTNRVILARRLHARLRECRTFTETEVRSFVPAPESPTGLQGWLHGFVCAEGSFALGRRRQALNVHLRQDDRPLLEMLVRCLGVGYVRDYPAYPPGRPSSLWSVTRLEEVAALASWLHPELMRGRKAAEFDVWLRGVSVRRAARAAGRRAPRESIERLVEEFKRVREYRPGTVRPVDPPDTREATLEVLRSWADSEPGPLSVNRYDAARVASGRTWPHRNTVARRFGSWSAALAAAGLADREASHAVTREAWRAGGSEARIARATAQRERVLATLALCVASLGRVPPAMEFFRWRLANAPASPTQATVYRLFPGGWPAVLRAAGLMSTS
jgi:hypothetical protein